MRAQGFFYETVAPILSVGSASLVAISTLTSEINFYTRLIKVRVFAHLHGMVRVCVCSVGRLHGRCAFVCV